MASVSPMSAESGNPKPGPSRKTGTAPSDTFELMRALLAERAAPDPLPRRWPQFALFAAGLAVLAAGWWFYRDQANGHSETTIPPALAGEVPAKSNLATKPAELDGMLQQTELLSKAYEEMLAKQLRVSAELEQKLAAREKDGQLLVQERARTKELEDQLTARRSDQQLLADERQRRKELEERLATRQNDQQSLTQARARIKELEQQLSASRQLPQPTTSSAAANASRDATPVYQPPDERTKPQPTVRRTGPRPLPNATQPMPRLSLQASDLTYNSGYWQVTAILTSNTSRALEARIQCSFLDAGRSVEDAEFGPTSVAPGEQVSTDLIGPPTTVHVDSTTCRLVGK